MSNIFSYLLVSILAFSGVGMQNSFAQVKPVPTLIPQSHPYIVGAEFQNSSTENQAIEIHPEVTGIENEAFDAVHWTI